LTRIATVDAITVRVPLDEAAAFSGRRVDGRYYTLVKVTGDDGISGIGFCYSGHKAGHIATEAVRHLFAPCLIGDDAHRVTGIWEDLYQEGLLHGRAGAVMRAQSAIDIALWDRNARAAGLPLWKFLGSVAADRVPAYASGGYYKEGKENEDLATEMAGYVAAGFRAVKMKVGRLTRQEDALRIAAVREAVGPDVELMLDANNAWRDFPSALAAIRAWERYDPFFLEEPFPPDDVLNHTRLAAATHVPIATGEIEAGRWRHRELVTSRAAVILQTDAAVCGGITEWRRIAALADAFGLQMYPHWFHDLHAHLVASTANARYVEYFPDDLVFNFSRLITKQLVVDDGMLRLPADPGLGFDFDDGAVARFAQDTWA
jgi:L-alanine-DL-glutamate epimerase and related enzymes of enolase superfamily